MLMSTTAVILAFAALITLNIAYLLWNSLFMNKVIIVASRLLKKEIQPIHSSISLFLFIQFMYMCSWSLMGFGGYFLAKGIGLTIFFDEHVCASCVNVAVMARRLSRDTIPRRV